MTLAHNILYIKIEIKILGVEDNFLVEWMLSMKK